MWSLMLSNLETWIVGVLGLILLLKPGAITIGLDNFLLFAKATSVSSVVLFPLQSPPMCTRPPRERASTIFCSTIHPDSSSVQVLRDNEGNSDHLPLLMSLTGHITKPRWSGPKPIGWKCRDTDLYNELIDLSVQQRGPNVDLSVLTQATALSAKQHGVVPSRRCNLPCAETATLQQLEARRATLQQGPDRLALTKQISKVRRKLTRPRAAAKVKRAANSGSTNKGACYRMPRALLCHRARDNWRSESATFFNDIFSGNSEDRHRWLQEVQNHQTHLGLQLQTNGVQEAIHLLNKRKSCAEDHITGEMLQSLGEASKAMLTEAFNRHIQGLTSTPVGWYTVAATLLPKQPHSIKGQDTTPITLLPVMYKLYMRCLMTRFRTHIEEVMHNWTLGFRKGHQPAEGIGTLRH